MIQLWTQTLWALEVNGTTNTSGAEAIVFPDQTLPYNLAASKGSLQLTAMGKFSNVVTTPGSITFRLRYGGVGGTLLAQTSAIPLNIIAQTDIMWRLQLDVVTRLSGASGSVLAMGVVMLAQQLAANNNQQNFMGSAGGLTTNTPAAVTVDLTAAPILSLTYQSTVATGSMTGMMYKGESLN
jgi:hypothetical protein